jgi:hypothetical protein
MIYQTKIDAAKNMARHYVFDAQRSRFGEQCVTHGPRKAAARRLDEAGCSANESAAITGHLTLKEVGRYTKSAEQRTLAAARIERLAKQKSNENFQT